MDPGHWASARYGFAGGQVLQTSWVCSMIGPRHAPALAQETQGETRKEKTNARRRPLLEVAFCGGENRQ